MSEAEASDAGLAESNLRMNGLEFYIKSHKLDPVAVMNHLQNAGFVSDNCISPETVADIDRLRAIGWLEYESKRLQLTK